MSFIKVINDKDIESFFNNIGINRSNNEKSNLISIIKDILPDKNNYIKCIIEKDKGNIKTSNKTKLPFIQKNCDDIYCEKLQEILKLLKKKYNY